MEFYSFANLQLRLYKFFLFNLVNWISKLQETEEGSKKLVTVLKEVITVKMFFL